MKRIILSLIFAFALSGQASAAITAFGAASTADTAGAARAVTPPGSMLANDYVVMIAAMNYSSSGNTLSISNSGGQTWTSETQLDTLPSGGTNGTTTVSTRVFHCRFNGTWSASPSVVANTTNAEALTIVMLVFRGVDTTNAIDVSPVSASYDATTQVTVTEMTTVTNNAMAVVFWVSRDDNTWALNTMGWSQQHTHVSNSAGGDNSISHAYKIQATAGGTGAVRNDQTVLGGDAGHTWKLALKEQVAAVDDEQPSIIVVE